MEDRGDPPSYEHGDSPEGDSALAESDLEFVLMIDALKQVVRQNPIASGERRERTAEHSWHVAIAAICLHKHATEEIDLDKAVRLAVIHDLPEVLVGDTFVYGRQAATRRAREQCAVDDLVGQLSGNAGELVRESWTEYEYESTPEGRYVMALDVILPVFLNLAAGRNSSWYKHNVSASDVRKRILHIQAAVPRLAEAAMRAIDSGARQGLLVEG